MTKKKTSGKKKTATTKKEATTKKTKSVAADSGPGGTNPPPKEKPDRP